MISCGHCTHSQHQQETPLRRVLVCTNGLAISQTLRGRPMLAADTRSPIVASENRRRLESTALRCSHFSPET